MRLSFVWEALIKLFDAFLFFYRHKRTHSPFLAENSVSQPSSHSAISQTGFNVSKKSTSSHTTNVADRLYDTEAESQQSVTHVSGGRLNYKNSNKEVRCGKTMADQVETRDLSQPKQGDPQPTKPYMTGNRLCSVSTV